MANIPAELADSASSTFAWAGGQLGIGDDTYNRAPRVTTGDVETGVGSEAGSLTPQSTKDRVGAALLPFLTPGGKEKAAETVTSKAPGVVAKRERVVTSLVDNMADSALGTLANNSTKDDPDTLASDLAINSVGGMLFNKVGSVAKEAIIGSKKGLTKLSNEVATVNKGKQLAADVDKTANDLTKADLRYTNSMRKNASEDEIKTLRNDYLDKEEVHNAAKEALNNHINPNPVNTAELLPKVQNMNVANTKGSNYQMGDLNDQMLARYGIRPRMLENINKGKGKSFAKYIGHKAIHLAGFHGGGYGGYLASKAATRGMDALTNSIANRAGRKGLQDMEEALQGTYTANADIGYQEAL